MAKYLHIGYKYFKNNFVFIRTLVIECERVEDIIFMMLIITRFIP